MNSERRLARRFIMRVPLRFRPIEGPAIREQSVESMNISRRGVYFPTDVKLKEGSLVRVRLTMPEEIIGSEATECSYTCRVAHVEPLSPANGKFGVGVQFLYYEIVQNPIAYDAIADRQVAPSRRVAVTPAKRGESGNASPESLRR